MEGSPNQQDITHNVVVRYSKVRKSLFHSPQSKKSPVSAKIAKSSSHAKIIKPVKGKRKSYASCSDIEGNKETKVKCAKSPTVNDEVVIQINTRLRNKSGKQNAS